jgi:lambda family phage tail tape measure protein
MSTTIGEVNINLRMNLAEFKRDVKDGADASSRATKQIADEAKQTSREATASLALIGEEIGVTIPRHVRTLIATLPGVGGALAAAFDSIAIITIIGIIAEMIDKLKDFADQAEKIEKAWDDFGLSGQKALSGLHEEFLSLQIQLDKLANDNAKALRDQLQLIDAQSLSNLQKQFEQLSTESDKAFDAMRQSWFKTLLTFGNNSTVTSVEGGIGEFFTALWDKVTPSNKVDAQIASAKEGLAELMAAVQKFQQAGDFGHASQIIADGITKMQDAIKNTANPAVREVLEKQLAVLQQIGLSYHGINVNADAKKQIAEITETTNALDEQLGTLKSLEEATRRIVSQNDDRFTREEQQTEQLIQSWKEYAEELERSGINSGAAGQAIQQLTQHLADLQAMAERSVQKLMGLSDESRKMVNDFISSAALTKNIKLPAFGDTAQEQNFQEQLLRINALMADGKLTAEQYGQAVQQLRFQFGEGGAATGVKEFFQEFQAAGQEAAQVYDLLKTGMDGFLQNLSETLATGKANWADYFASIEEMILKSSLQTLLKQALGFLNNSDFFSSLGGGNLFGSGGIFGPGHASGGPVMPGTIYPVGEKGIEYFRPNVPGQILTQDQLNNASGKSRGGTIVNNFNLEVHGVTDADSFKKSAPQLRAELYRSGAMAHQRNSR